MPDGAHGFGPTPRMSCTTDSGWSYPRRGTAGTMSGTTTATGSMPATTAKASDQRLRTLAGLAIGTTEPTGSGDIQERCATGPTVSWDSATVNDKSGDVTLVAMADSFCGRDRARAAVRRFRHVRGHGGDCTGSLLPCTRAPRAGRYSARRRTTRRHRPLALEAVQIIATGTRALVRSRQIVAIP